MIDAEAEEEERRKKVRRGAGVQTKAYKVRRSAEVLKYKPRPIR